MRYFDTSFLAPLILTEAASAKAERFIMGLPADELATSHWARVEVASLLAQQVRMGKLGKDDAVRADIRFETMVAESYVVVDPRPEDFELALRFLLTPSMSLRAGDALHLAIAANRRVEMIYSLDKTMVKAGRMLGLPVERGITP